MVLWQTAQAAPAIALYGEPKYKPGFTHFDYVNPNAPKGGSFKLSSPASFDSTNPFIIKGVAAPGVANFVYQSLMTGSYDEPQSFYGLIADDADIAPDRGSVVFHLNPAARWQDGKAITPEDVVWSLDTLKTKGHPQYRALYKPITKAEILPGNHVRFIFAEKNQRELPLIAAAMPVLPKHYFESHPFDKTSLEAPLGSGPYKVSGIDPGRSISFARDPHYWGADLPSQRGLNNFDSITIDTYRDDTVAIEAIKSGAIDYYEEFIARNWATAYNIPAVTEGRIKKIMLPHKIPRGMQGFIFNTRRDKFSDQRVREAIGLTLDFEWMNQTLFYGAYTRNKSFFEATEFESSATPQGEELKLLEKYREQLPASLFTTPYQVGKTDGSGYSRERLIRAQQLLNDAGWVMRDGHRVNAKTGEPLTIEFLMHQRTFERVIGIMRQNLAKLGIDSEFRYVDASQYQKRLDKFNFDIVSIWINQGLFYPGSEQFLLWHSSQANVVGGQNLGGIQSPVVDDLVMRIQKAKNLDDLRSAARALDRVLEWEYYVIPHWTIHNWRVAYWDKFERPSITPAYNVAWDSWWAKEVVSKKEKPRP